MSKKSTDSSKKYRPSSDGDPSKGSKTGKYCKSNNNYCSTHGYDVANNHTSGTCRFPGPNHNRKHTGDNPKLGANQKDKHFSKWAGEPPHEDVGGIK